MQIATTLQSNVKKATSAVHSSGQLSLLQRKICNSLLYYAFNDLLTTEEHVITVGQLCKLINYSGNNYDVLKQALKGLCSLVVEWNIIDEDTGEDDWTASSVLASVNIKGATCSYAYSPRMRALLANPKMYAKINLYIQSRFHSTYGLALYENCIRYRGLISTRWFEMDKFRKLMGVSSEKYAMFNDFKKRVINKAIDEVNTYSDIKIAIEYSRVGCKVVKLRFLLKERPKKQKLNIEKLVQTTQETGALFDELKQTIGISSTQIKRFIQQYDIAYIKEKLNYVKSTKLYKSRRGRSEIAAYFVAAMKNDYIVKTIVQPESIQPLQQKMSVDENQRQKTILEIINRIKVMPKDKQTELLNQFGEFVAGTIYGALYKKEGITNPLVSDQLYLFYKKNKVRLWK